MEWLGVREARYLVRVVNKDSSIFPASIGALIVKLNDLQLSRHENVRVSHLAVEFDLYEDSRPKLDDDLKSIDEGFGRVLSVRELKTEDSPRTLGQSISLAKGMYREERFWEVHEELEYQWRKLKRGDPEKEMLQGLILYAAALVHVQKDQGKVAFSMLDRAISRMEAARMNEYQGFDVAGLISLLRKMKEAGDVVAVELPLARISR